MTDKKDITLTCKDCGQEFLFTVGEQEFFETKGLTNQPVRCKECRDKKRNSRPSNGFKPRNNNFNQERRAA